MSEIQYNKHFTTIIRKNLDWNTRDLTKRLKVSPPMCYSWEKGTSKPHTNSLGDVVRVFHNHSMQYLPIWIKDATSLVAHLPPKKSTIEGPIKYNTAFTNYLREKLGNISQEDLAKLINVNTGKVQNWERGVNVPNSTKIGKFFHLAKDHGVKTLPIWKYRSGCLTAYTSRSASIVDEHHNP
jgi:DNA-binding transcriptional regulator YiaG